jgi:hypothetical protein
LTPSPYIRSDLAPRASVLAALRRGRSGAPSDGESAEGWCTDPFERHEARWMSDGTPTKLVRDGEVESYDPPDEEPAPTP